MGTTPRIEGQRSGVVAGVSVVWFQGKAQLGSPIGRIWARFRTSRKNLPEVASTHVPLTLHPLSKLRPSNGQTFVVPAHDYASYPCSGKFSVFHPASGLNWRYDGEPHFEVERLLRCFQMVVEKRSYRSYTLAGQSGENFTDRHRHDGPYFIARNRHVNDSRGPRSCFCDFGCSDHEYFLSTDNAALAPKRNLQAGCAADNRGQ